MAQDGILGGSRSVDRSSSRSCRDEARLKRREAWLVLLGVALHAVYMLSIFDIYFKSPIVHGAGPVPQRISPPARRLVLVIADGLRADKFFEPDHEGRFRNPFLRSVMVEKGRWGVSHARPPTESRPGHVAIIAGFYEDPSAVTKGWKANPVEFDSVFNRSRHTFAFGSPDIVPIFCSALPHSTWKSYPHEFEDFAADASFLDQWSYDELHNLLNLSYDDPALKQLLMQDNLVIFLHLLGCDTNGHAHRPFSSIYLNNVNVVDRIAESVYNLVENYFKDNKTAYIFTADHGMSDKGSHGDGHPTNTDTPLVSWGAGIRNPRWTFHNSQPDDGFRFVDDHKHDLVTPSEWNLEGLERVDVNQADIAPLMATLVGLPCPVNSVGRVPLGYLKLSKAEEVEADLANAKQILNQFLRKSKLKQENSLYFKPFKPLEGYSSILLQIEDLLSTREYETALEMSETLRNLSLAGLHYFQTYDWFMLMTTITLGYVGWMINLVIHIILSYTSLQVLKKNEVLQLESNKNRVYLGGCLLMGVISFLLFVEKSPLLYHAYFAMTLFLWSRVFGDLLALKGLWRLFSQGKVNSMLNLVIASFVAVIILEFLVSSFTNRRLYTWCFLIVGVVGGLFLLTSIPRQPSRAIFLLVVCWFLSTFTLMPAEIPDNTELVLISGAFVIMIGTASRWFESNNFNKKASSCAVLCEKHTSRLPKFFLFQVLLVGLSSVMVWITTSHRTQKRELLFMHQVVNWSISGISVALPLFSPTSLLLRLTSIFLGFATPFLLLSIGYEALFYGALTLVLMGWILLECSILDIKTRNFCTHMGDESDISDVNHNNRNLQLSDLRVPLIFMVLFNVAFFGTGNFASIASFEISSVYRFITIFSPFLMTSLLIFKLFIPYMLVICVFSAITKVLWIPRIGCYFLVILFSDMMTIHFFFLVRNTGSWMEIGNSISHFGIMSAQVVFVLLLFALTNIYTKDIKVNFLQSSLRKVI